MKRGKLSHGIALNRLTLEEKSIYKSVSAAHQHDRAGVTVCAFIRHACLACARLYVCALKQVGLCVCV